MQPGGGLLPSIDTTKVNSGQANTIPARFNSVTNTFVGTQADGRSKGYNYAELADCRKHCGCYTRNLATIRNYNQSRTTINRPGNERIPN
jgi:hypothetical protein